MVRRERSRRALPVHQKRLLFALQHVLFHLGDVVRDVVDDVHVQIVWCGVEDFGEGLPWRSVRMNTYAHAAGLYSQQE